MRILITNDDSVSASQLLPLIRWCQQLGEVTTVVPAFEQSGKSHSIELHKPFTVGQRELSPGITVHTVDSSPADCVRYALFGLGLEFDLVISGINRGFNIGTDVMYSGTVAAIFEAALLGIPAVALSTSPGYYEQAVTHLDQILEYIRKNQLMDIHSLYNINIPPEPKSILITRQGGAYYSDDFHINDGLCTPCGKCVFVPSGDLTLDTDAVMEGYISITPLTIVRTHMDIFCKLTEQK